MEYSQFKKTIFKYAYEKRIPLLGEFELTSRCNLNCEMCYVHESNVSEQLSTGEWKTIFNQAINSGLMYAVLTGGEILLRSDFIELYTYLYDAGVKISLFTNGTLLTEEIVSMLSKRPPEYVAITLYGSNNHTYELLTKVKDGFNRVNQGIDLLQKKKIKIKLRTIPLKIIMDELDDIITFVKSKELTLQYFLYVGPTRSLCQAPLSLRLSPIELVKFEDSINKAFFNNKKSGLKEVDSSVHCGALKNGYFINYLGFMQPCALAYKPKVNIINQSLLESFHTLRLNYEKLEELHNCASCSVSTHCIKCYARRLLEGNAKNCSPYLNKHAILRGNIDEDL